MPHPNEPTGSSQNAPDQEGNTQEGNAPGLDPQQLAQLVNSAVSAHLKRVLPKALESSLPSIVDAVTKQVAATAAAAKPKDEDGDKNKPPSPEVVALQRKVEELNANLKEEREARATAEKKRRDDRAFGDLRQALTDGKVRPEMVDTLAKVLFFADKRLEFDDDDKPLLRVPVSPGKGYPDQEQTFPLADGVKQYLKTKAAEPFLPAPGGAAVQSGTSRPAATAQRGQTPPTYDSPAKTDQEAARRTLEQLAAMGLQGALLGE